MILRRLPGAGMQPQGGVSQMSLGTEAELLRVAGRHGVAVPRVLHVLRPADKLGEGYLMSRERGEALPFRLLVEQRYAQARARFAFECGQTLGRIHQIPVAQLPAGLRDQSIAEQLARTQQLLDEFGNASPVHQLALNWLREHQPPEGPRSLVHGDFRMGNLLLDESALVAVLDWELAHVGNPVEDLGYLCCNVWRFGREPPVGGCGDYEDLLAGYRAVTGSAPPLDQIHYWQVFGTLGWGLVCLTMIELYRSGQDRSLERAAVGRRLSESEIDLLVLLHGRL
jgi:aminoglycoside phosphotransferase (APT) family kinase protein